MKQNKLYNVAIYCRLSLDDGNEGDSSSIKIQKMMLEKKQECKLNFSTQMIGKALKFIQEEKKDGYHVGYSENYLRLYVKDLKQTNGEEIKVKVIASLLQIFSNLLHFSLLFGIIIISS